jgi:hypothetical protein
MLLAVGHPVPGWKGPVKEGGEFNIDRGGARLKLAYATPHRVEIKAFRENPIRIGLVRAGVHTAFLLFDIQGCTDGWCDASYALGLVDPDYRDIDHRSRDKGWLLAGFLIDAVSGIVCGLRMATMTPAFSQLLDDLVAEQRVALPEFTRQRHNAEIAAAHARWPKPKDMAKDALAIETAGISFEKFPSDPAGRS